MSVSAAGAGLAPFAPNPKTYAEATICAQSAPLGMFGIDDLIVLVEVIYYGYEIWKACHAQASATDSPKEGDSTKEAGFGIPSRPEPLPLEPVEAVRLQMSRHPAERSREDRAVLRACRFKGVRMTPASRAMLANHMLSHAASVESGTMSACCAESPAAAVAEVEGFEKKLPV